MTVHHCSAMLGSFPGLASEVMPPAAAIASATRASGLSSYNPGWTTAPLTKMSTVGGAGGSTVSPTGTGGAAYTPQSWTAWCKRAEAGAVPGAVDFLNYAFRHGVHVFYITNRRQTEKAGTVANPPPYIVRIPQKIATKIAMRPASPASGAEA